MKTYDGRVIKAVASKFFVDTSDGVKVCFARKRLKNDGIIFVGDYVRIAKERDSFVIEDVKPRKNCLIRPYVSNVDVCFIVIAPEPEPDFILVDKVIVNCLAEGIEPILVKNKTDLGAIDTSEYDGVVKQIECSASTAENVSVLIEAAKGKTACFAGQSAVGKSSLLNAILDSDELEVGELTRKIKRGKNTTRKTEIFAVGNDTYFVDTCGFSMLEAAKIEPEELRLYFDDLEKYRPLCRFNMCVHIDEPDCEVKKHVGKEIRESRYRRYKAIYDELIQRRGNKYD